MIIKTTSLRIRTFTAGDVPAMLAMSREDCARKWLPSQVYRDEVHAAKAVDWLIQQFDLNATPRTNAFVFGVEEKLTGRLIGHVGLSPIFADVEVGFGIATSEQGKGYATEAVTAACHWALGLFSLPSIVGLADDQNVASQRVLIRSGFRRKEDRTMCFQSVERPVVIFELEGRQPNQSPQSNAGIGSAILDEASPSHRVLLSQKRLARNPRVDELRR